MILIHEEKFTLISYAPQTLGHYGAKLVAPVPPTPPLSFSEVAQVDKNNFDRRSSMCLPQEKFE
jgi:hypothetical protein